MDPKPGFDWLDLALYQQQAAQPDLRALDLALGNLLWQEFPLSTELALRLAVLCSARLIHGDPNLDLRQLALNPPALLPATWLADAASWLAPDWQTSANALREAGFVGDGSGAQPLVLQGERLYLARYWRASKRISRIIGALLADDSGWSEQAYAPWLRRLFPATNSSAPDWQRQACALALEKRFAIIIGGPGTGKTTTVVKLLAALQGLALADGKAQGLQIRLAAPTGKAAARLQQSIASAKEHPALAQSGDAQLARALALVPDRASTLHSLLRLRPAGAAGGFGAHKSLDLDVLVVDEASMLDVEMTDAMLAALPAHARLVLLGDRDQLASVEAGAVLGELCQAGPPLNSALAGLRVSYRFGADSGIGRFAALVNDSEPKRAQAQLRDLLATQHDDLKFFTPDTPQWPGSEPYACLRACGLLGDHGLPRFFQELQARRPPDSAAGEQALWDQWARAVLRDQGRWQLLCALRKGPWGVNELNAVIEQRLLAAGLLADFQPTGAQAGAWYSGKPVLVTRNQPQLGLANGDIGVVLRLPDARRVGASSLRVAFALADGVHWYSPARLNHLETVYALTVHKSQGSEFDRVVLALPDKPSPILTRELLYTGATRARQELSVILPAGEQMLFHAAASPVRRTAGVWNP